MRTWNGRPGSRPAIAYFSIWTLSNELFERGTTEASLTAIGEKVVVQAQRALDEAALVTEVAQQGRNQLHGPLRLGVIHTVGPYLLPELIPALKRRAPAMPLTIEESTTTKLDLLLKRGLLDVIIVALPHDEPGIVTGALYDEPFQVVVPRDHAWKKRRAVSPKELAGDTLLVLQAGHCFRDQVLNTCPELSRPDREFMQGNSLETIRSMVASGLGITVLPCSALAHRFRSDLIRAIPFEPPVPSRRIALAWRNSFARPKAIQALRASIHALRIPCLTPLAGDPPPAIA